MHRRKLKQSVRSFLEGITALQGLLLVSVNDINPSGLIILVLLFIGFISCIAILEVY